jgi:pilus assembly protein Flp/PilA
MLTRQPSRCLSLRPTVLGFSIDASDLDGPTLRAVLKEWQMSKLARLVREDHGQDLVEYAMLLALIALVVVGGVTAFGTAISGWYDRLSTNLPGGGGAGS